MSNLIHVGKINKKQLLTMERTVRRESDIENGFSNFKHKVHKSKKSYNRNQNKNFED